MCSVYPREWPEGMARASGQGACGVESRATDAGVAWGVAPHFLDSDWRFTTEAAISIVNSVQRRCPPNGRVAYLGCPTVAMWHAALCGDIDFVLLDRGHPGIHGLLEAGRIPARRFRPYDVCGDVPADLCGAFDMVVVDPPWYLEYIGRFWLRSLQLLRRSGWLSIVEYPGYRRDKQIAIDSLWRTMVGGMKHVTREESLSVSYDVPAFEQSWGGEVGFITGSRSAYRATSLTTWKVAKRGGGVDEGFFRAAVALPVRCWSSGRKVDIGGGHYLRCVCDPSVLLKGVAVRPHMWKGLRRPGIAELDAIIGWSTRNTVLMATRDARPLVHSTKDLGELCRGFELRCRSRAA